LLKKFSLAVVFVQILTSFAPISVFAAVVTPGQEQERFERETRESAFDRGEREPQPEASVQFASSEPAYESSEEEAPSRSNDDEDESPRRAEFSGDRFAIPIRGAISLADLKELAERIKDIEAEDGEVEVFLTLEVARKPGTGPSRSSKTRATEDFEKPIVPGDPKERADLRRAENQAAAEQAAAAEAQAGELQISEELPFFVEKVTITGNSALTTAELEPLTDAYEGREIKLSQARELAEKITAAYRSQGYITCRAYIPPQDVQSRNLTIKVFEGKLGKVKVRGNKFFSKRVIKRYVGHLRDQVLKFDSLKDGLRQMNLHPDREVKAVIVPGQEVGTSDLLLDVKDRRPIHINAEVNNFGTKDTGRERYSLSVRHSNLLGQDDIFASRVQFGEEVLAIGLQHLLPVGPYGTNAGWTFNYTDVQVGGDFSVLDIGGEAFTWSTFVNHPLYEGDRLDVTGTTSFESKSIYNTVLNQASSEDQLRMVHAGVNLDWIDPYGRTFLVNDLTYGSDWFGASEKNDPRLSRRGSGADFFKYNGSLNRIHPVYDQTYLFMKGSTQLTPDALVSAEQFDLGGVYSVRGYPQSDYLGDGGVGGSLELRLPWYFLPKEVKAPGLPDTPLWDKVHFVGFFDAASASLRKPAVGEDPSKTFFGAGGGLRIELPNNFLARFEYGVPVGDDPTDGSNGQFYFTISGDWI